MGVSKPIRRNLKEGGRLAVVTRRQAIAHDHVAVIDNSEEGYSWLTYPERLVRAGRAGRAGLTVDAETGAAAQAGTSGAVCARRARALRRGGGKRVAPGRPLVWHWPLESSFGWYDLTLSVEGDAAFEQRLAGHVETGRNGVSDPALGR